MKHITGKTINEVVYKSLESIIVDGYRTPSRNGDISTIYNAFVEIESPKSRHLNLIGRKNNIFATIAETFWVFAGSNKIDPYLSFFLPRAKDFSDDGETWRGGYPERIKNGNQIKDVIDQFKNEGIFTRRAVTVIYDANLDTSDNLKKEFGIETTKDRPCNLIMDFFITPDKRLHMNVKSRSGDVLWGFGSINIFEWTFYQEMILQYIKENIDFEVTIGSYNHHITNLHLYDFSGKQGYDVVENKLKQTLGLINTDQIIFPDIDKVHDFFGVLVKSFSYAIEEKSIDYELLYEVITLVFEDYDIPTNGNILFEYASLISAYICAKNMNLEKGVKTNEIVVDLKGSDEFTRSIKDSSFRKFTLEINGDKYD